MFEVVLNDKSLKGITDYTKRLNIITKDLFQVNLSASSQGSAHTGRGVVATQACFTNHAQKVKIFNAVLT